MEEIVVHLVGLAGSGIVSVVVAFRELSPFHADLALSEMEL